MCKCNPPILNELSEIPKIFVVTLQVLFGVPAYPGRRERHENNGEMASDPGAAGGGGNGRRGARSAGFPGCRPEPTIHVHNYAGVDSQWIDAPLQEQEYTADPQSAGLSHIWVNIMPAAMSDRMNLAPGVTGLAPGAGPDRVLAYIFYNRVEEMRQKQLAAFLWNEVASPSTVGDLLGSAMAHEIGHILLNLAVHSKSGIMQGNWDLNVLNDIACSRLEFTKQQGEVIRTEVARRARTQELLATVAAPGASY
jgi:hypothetical protein